MSVEKIRTPAYVFDIDRLIRRIRKMKGFFGKNVSVCFAIKANPFVIGAIKDEVDCFEVCSPGEFRICERAAVPPEKIVLSGVYKNEDDIKRIIGICKDNAVYTVESPMLPCRRIFRQGGSASVRPPIRYRGHRRSPPKNRGKNRP